MGIRPDIDYDGGWEELVDSGDGIEEILIGPEQRYDVPQGHVPHERFATRHAVPGRRGDLDIENIASDQLATSRQATARSIPPPPPLTKKQSKGRSNAAKRAASIEAVAAANNRTPEQIESAVLGNRTDGQRAALLSTDITEIKRLRSQYAGSVAGKAVAPRKQSPGALPSKVTTANKPASAQRNAAPPATHLKALKNDRQVKALKAAARAAGVSHAVASDLLRGPGTFREKAVRHVVTLATVQGVCDAYRVELKRLGSPPAATPAKVRRATAPKSKTMARPPSSDTRLKLAPLPAGPRDDRVCMSCEQPIRLDSTCGCSN